MAILISGSRVILRDRLPSDADTYVYWHDHGEWLEYDAPWEDTSGPLTQERRDELRQDFIDCCAIKRPDPRRQAIIADRENRPIGWVNTYWQEGVPDTLYVGIGIGQDDYLNRGFGTEALWLWIDYLYAHTRVGRIGLETWSFNPRMIRAAEKVGLKLENVKYNEREWRGQWLDGLQFYVLRSEWLVRRREGGKDAERT